MSEPILEREPHSSVIVSFKDCDAYGFLYNTRYLDYIMDARAEHLLKFYRFDFHVESQRTKEAWVVHGHQIAYIEPARVHEEITVRTRMLHFNGNTALLEGMILNRDQTRLKALQWTKLSYVSLIRGTSQNHPAELLAFLSRFRAQEDVPEPLDFDSRVKHLRARFQTSKMEK